MKIRALSNYNGDTDTRFGDCILVYNIDRLVVYDCGSQRHKQEVMTFLQGHNFITKVVVVLSHNDSDHTRGVCELLEELVKAGYDDVTLYSPLYLKDTDAVMKQLDDDRRTAKKTREHILDTFDHIQEAVEKAEELGIAVKNTEKDTTFADCEVVGPTVEEFAEVVAAAIDDASGDDIDGETVMNAASVQLKCRLDGDVYALLCGDATAKYLRDLDDYQIIQLPHHGKKENAVAIFKALKDPYRHEYLISDNTGSAQNSGGSDELVEYMRQQKMTAAHNTKNGVVDLPKTALHSSREVTSHVLGP